MNKNYFTGFDGVNEDYLGSFVDNLPRGFGIDCDWGGYTTEKYVYFTNSYHAMNENGYYEGYQDFQVRIDKNDFMRLVSYWEKYDNYQYEPSKEKMKNLCASLISSIKDDYLVQFTGNRYLATKHYLHDYLYDTFYWAFSEIGSLFFEV